jgi:Sulfotransferase family
MGVSVVSALAGSHAAATGASAATAGFTGKPGQEPIVVYIAGSGRSGSTLLERALGEIPGFVNVGELIDLYRRTAAHGELCGCGQAFARCPFWSRVGERAFGGWHEQKLTATHRLQGKVARQRHVPRLLAMPLAGRRFRADVAGYGASYASLYAGIAAEAGAACVVDASKWPVQALALARAGLDVRVIHLVRDVRGVAYSLGKRDVTRPHAVTEADVMTHLSAAEAAARWVAVQSQAGLLRWCGLPVHRMRYEEFVRRPRQAVAAALAGIGLPAAPADLGHIGDGRVVLGTSHGLSGNPSRFTGGEITLRADEAWRARMSRRDRLVVTAIGLPLMLRYGLSAAGSPVEKPEAND